MIKETGVTRWVQPANCVTTKASVRHASLAPLALVLLLVFRNKLNSPLEVTVKHTGCQNLNSSITVAT